MPLSPATWKDRVVVLVESFDAIVMFVICEVVMFPLIERLIVAPSSVLACRVVGNAVGLGVAIGICDVGDGVAEGAGFGEPNA